VGKDGLGLGGGMARKARDDEGDEYELGEILSVSRGYDVIHLVSKHILTSDHRT